MKKLALSLGLGGYLASMGSYAADYTTLINGAGTEANANQAAVIAAVITLAVIGFGATAIVLWMRK